VTKQLKQA